MSRPVPRLRWRICMPAVVSLVCLVAPPVTALAQQPDPAPLWKAYPLTPGESTRTTPAEHPNGAPLVVDESPRTGTPTSAGNVPPARVPLAVAVGFYMTLAGLSALLVGALTLHVLRRRAARPVTCEISWSPDEEGDAFRATAQRDGEEQWVVAQSRRFERRSPDPPSYDATSHAAYDELLRNLYADGWLPYERGREWWAMRLRRTEPSDTPTPTRRG